MPFPPSPTLRIAVLEADNPLPHIRTVYGGYGDIFTKLLHTAAANKLRWPLSSLDISVFNIYTHPERYPNLEDIDGVLITGSKANAFDNEPWIQKLVEFVEMLVMGQERVRVIGVCFGHQILARALGGRVERNKKGWEASVCDVSLSREGMELWGVSVLSIFQMHHDIVTVPPSCLPPKILGSTPKCAVQGMLVPGRYISIQGHPEFTPEIVREILKARHAAGVFSDEEYKDMWARLEKPHDGVLIAAEFLRFLVE